jgi:cell division transport system ATP-binding protein
VRLFIELNKLGTAIVMATHDWALMEQMPQRRLILTDGRIKVEE